MYSFFYDTIFFVVAIIPAISIHDDVILFRIINSTL
ncbi:hypothetical protein GGD38_006417 [Chitinophagaceae bacterium OAS944]|nr:hypothetical protein [Chitinophagaceae bacterium OAS944]